MSEPRSGIGYWTAYQPPEGDTRPLDPLGFGMYAERLGNQLLPGLTGRTTRLRYLGMVCAGLFLTSERLAPGDRRIARARIEPFLRFERGWALAVCHFAEGQLKELNEETNRRGLTHEFRDLRGANHVLSYWRGGMASGARWVRPNRYKLLQGQSAQGGLGAYLVTLHSAGFVDRSNLALREPGRQLAEAFLADHTRRAQRLYGTDKQRWDMLWRLGRALDLRQPSSAEAAILKREIFNTGSGVLAPAVRGLGLKPADPEVALRRLSKCKNLELASAARYALAFDPLRRSALEAFGALGRKMSADGELSVRSIPTDAAESADSAARAARKLASLRPPDGLAPVQGLATRLGDCAGPLAILDQLLDWHRQHRAPWILREGKRFVLGRKGNFDLYPQFHGFTVGSYYSLVEDLALAGKTGT